MLFQEAIMRICSWWASTYLFPCVTSARQVKFFMVTQDNILCPGSSFLSWCKAQICCGTFWPLIFKSGQKPKFHSCLRLLSGIYTYILRDFKFREAHPIEFSLEVVAVPESYPLEFASLLVILWHMLNAEQCFPGLPQLLKSMLTSNIFRLKVYNLV